MKISVARSGKHLRSAAPRLAGTDTRPVVLALVEDRVGSLASLLLAAEIAAARQGRLHVAHVKGPRLWWVGTAGIVVPADAWAETDCLAAAELMEKIAGLLVLAPPVEWTFTWTTDNVHCTVTRLVRALSPVAVVAGPPRRSWLPMRRSVAQWLIGRPDVPAVICPA